MEKTFETPGPVRLRVELPSGDLRLRASASPVTTVRLTPRGRGGEELAERFVVEQRGDEILVQAPKARDSLLGWGSKGSVDVEVELPERSELDVRAGSGDVAASGVLGQVAIGTGSGDVSLDELAGGEVKTGSGEIEMRTVRGPLVARTGSGDIAVHTANADVDLSSGSGDLVLRRAEGRVKAKTGSGDVTIAASVADLDVLTGTGDLHLGGIHGGEAKVRTGTGDVTLGVVTGVAAYVDLNTVTGDVQVDLEESSAPEDAEAATTSLTVQSGSGDIRVRRAQATLA
jgi:DUF4097 and DUF4098 domain-containing protein YvlB